MWFGVVALVLILGGAWEWGGIIGLSQAGRIGYCVGAAALVALLWPYSQSTALVWAGAGGAFLYWCYVVLWLRRYSATPQVRDSRLVWTLSGLGVLVVTWMALMGLRDSPGLGAPFVLFLVVLVWIADSGAFFAGRRWGRRKLAPSISPGKTWEGVYGALGATLVFSIVGSVALGIGGRWPLFILVSMVTVVFSVVGDLFESMVKRQWGVKDSGTVLPGHGGLLDRIDSLMAAAPIFLLGARSVVG
jgi:phosphatidate cytidylyltransferase